MSNILFISPNPIWGGAATANLSIASMLQKYGHNVIVNDEYYKCDKCKSLEIDHTPIHQRRFSDRSLLRQLIESREVDCMIWSPLAAIYFYQEIKEFKRLGINQISIVHSLSLTNNLKGKLMDYLISITLANMSSIIFVSHYTMVSWNKFNAIKKTKANKIIIHNVIDTNTVAYNPKVIKKPRVGFVGRLSKEKQPRLFCELAKDSDYDYIVYGEGPLKDDLRSEYPYIVFRGLSNDIRKIYSDIDVLVMTSKFENCPMVILEAQAYGIPCVAPNVGGIPEIISNGIDGILYNNYDERQILNSIDVVLSNYSNYSANCYSSSKKHVPSAVISQWESVINN